MLGFFIFDGQELITQRIVFEDRFFISRKRFSKLHEQWLIPSWEVPGNEFLYLSIIHTLRFCSLHNLWTYWSCVLRAFYLLPIPPFYVIYVYITNSSSFPNRSDQTKPWWTAHFYVDHIIYCTISPKVNSCVLVRCFKLFNRFF